MIDSKSRNISSYSAHVACVGRVPIAIPVYVIYVLPSSSDLLKIRLTALRAGSAAVGVAPRQTHGHAHSAHIMESLFQ